MVLRLCLGALALCLGMAACNDGAPSADPGETLTNDEVASAARDFVRPEPGLYRSTVEFLEVDIPGAPPQAEAMIRQSSGKGQVSEYCLTAADVEKGFEESVRKSQRGDCEYKRFDVDGGTIDALMICEDQGRSVELTLAGEGNATSSDMTMTMKMNMGEMGVGTIKAKSRSERIGACRS